MRNTIIVFAFAGATACGGTRPNDMSAAEHRAAAETAQQRADSLRAQGIAREPRAAIGRNFALASAMRARAAEHRAAAAALRDAETVECQGLPDAARHSCPLMDLTVRDVAQTDRGVRVTFDGAEASSLGRHARCHASHGATEGKDAMPGCPLYRPGLEVSTEPVEGGAILVLQSDDAASRKELQEMYHAEP